MPVNPKVIFPLVCFLVCTAAKAQTTKLTVIVQNENREKLTSATCELFSLPDSILITRKINSPGSYFIVSPKKNYFVRASATGMSSVSRSFLATDMAFELTLDLHKQVNNLKTVTIVSRGALVKQEDDKTVIAAETLASSNSNAYEVLEKVPGAVVDQDGNVYLNSATPATVFINGREIKLSTADLASLLKSLPAKKVCFSHALKKN